jgi:hypothetical protein
MTLTPFSAKFFSTWKITAGHPPSSINQQKMKLFGVFAGGLLGAFLFGKPSPSSPIGKAMQWVANTAQQDVPSLHYFDIRGRAEAIRIALSDREIEFNDASFTGEQWGRNSPDGLKAKWYTHIHINDAPLPLTSVSRFIPRTAF